MATYYGRRMYPSDTKYIVHPHYATQAEASNEAIGHQVRHFFSSTIYFFYFSSVYSRLVIFMLIKCDHEIVYQSIDLIKTHRAFTFVYIIFFNLMVWFLQSSFHSNFSNIRFHVVILTTDCMTVLASIVFYTSLEKKLQFMNYKIF